MTAKLVTAYASRHRPDISPDYFDSIVGKRILAYAVDVIAIMVVVAALWGCLLILGIFTLGATWPLLGVPSVLVPLAYHSLQIGGPRAATLGMRAMSIRVMSIAAGSDGHPTLPQAVIQTVTFYGSIAATGSLILIVALFNRRRRTLHDWLAGTVVINAFDTRIMGPTPIAGRGEP